jgi:hypothetical protein
MGKCNFNYFAELGYMCEDVDCSQMERDSIQGAVVKQARNIWVS